MELHRIAVLGILCTVAMFAQTDRSTITGTITDPAGAVVAGVPLEAKNTETGAVYQTVSTPTGNFTLPQIPAGSYGLSAAAPGFKKYIRSGITVPVAQTLRIDISLEVGATTESVTVTEQAPLLKTESGEVSHNIPTERLNNLPILATGGGLGIRNPYSMINLLPGTDFRPEGSVRINGLPGNSQSLRVEGQDSTNITWQQTTQIVQQSVDAIQEVAIQTSNFAAEFGQAGSAVFNTTMKSGTNQVHGSGFDYFVNEALNSGRPFVNTKPLARRNDYGFSLGGPVYIPKVYNGHDKFFFFFNFEQFRENVGVTGINTVPTDKMRKGDFSEILTGKNLCPAANPNCDPLGRPIFENTIYDPRSDRLAPGGQRVRDPFSGNILPPGLISSVASKVQSYFPAPNRVNAGNPLISNYQNSYTNPRLTYIPSVKVDYNLGTTSKLSGYWSETKADSPNNDIWSPLPISNAVRRTSQADTARINYDRTITPTKLLHVGIGVVHLTDNQSTDTFNQLQTLGLPGSQSSAFPYLQGLGTSFGGANAAGAGALGPIVLARINNIKPTAVTSLTWVKNNHAYKFGGELIVESFPSYSETFANNWYNFAGATTGVAAQQSLSGNTGFPYASFLLGQVNNGTVNVPSRGHLGSHAVAFYAQDSWKVTHKLTLDYGLRYDFQTYLKEQYGRWANFSPTALNPKASNLPGAIIYEGTGQGRCGCDYAKNYPLAFGPRLGLAYQFLPKTVLRAGIGISYGRTPELGYLNYTLSVFGGYSAPGFATPATTLNQGPPIPWSWPNFDPGLFVNPGTLSQPTVAIDPNAGRPPRTTMWSIGIQRELAHNLIVEASYVGNRSAWFQGNALTSPNGISTQRLAALGLDFNNSEVRTLLTSPVNSALAQKYNIKIPYAGFSPGSTVAQALRPYPQYGNFSEIWAPLGRTWYDSLQISATKRFSKGFDFNSNFTWQKELTLGAETTYNLFATITPQVNDVFNRNTNKTISGLSRPFVFVFAGNYTTQSWISNKALNWVVKDWTLGAVLRYQSGQPIRVPNSTSSLITTQLARGGSTFANRVPGQPLFLHDLNDRGSYDPSSTKVLNPVAWTEPVDGQFGTSAAYYNDYRYQRRPQENISLGRNFRFKERYSLMVRTEFTNIFNRTWYPDPNSTTYTQSQQTSGFGYINTVGAFPASQPLAPRQGTLVARFTF